MKRICTMGIGALLVVFTAGISISEPRTIADAAGRQVAIPDRVERVICSGPGCLRLLTYLEAQNLIVAVDDIEKRRSMFDARPYALANPQFRDYPLFGEFRGYDNPELIMTLEPQPQVILKTFATMGHDPEELQKKTGIPVVILEYGNLTTERKSLYQALRIVGDVVGKNRRPDEVIGFFESLIGDLRERTRDVPESQRKSCFVGGIAFKGPHGFQSTEPGYPPFLFVTAKNVAFDSGMPGELLRQSNVSKEKIVAWDPDILFLDLATLQMGNKAGGLYELKTDPVYQTLNAVKKGEVYGVFPYNWYTQNFGSILANAYFVGSLLSPDRFQDVDPLTKADEIYTFVVGKPVAKEMKDAFQGLAFERIPLN